MGPEPLPYTQPEYETNAEGDVEETSVSVDTSRVSGYVEDYQYLICGEFGEEGADQRRILESRLADWRAATYDGGR